MPEAAAQPRRAEGSSLLWQGGERSAMSEVEERSDRAGARPAASEQDEHGTMLAREDRDWLDRVAEIYRAPELAPGRRAAFDARLADRIARRQRRRGLLGAAAAAAAAAGLAGAGVWSLGGAPSDPPRADAPADARPAVVAGVPAGRGASGSDEAVEDALLDLANAELEASGEALPDEYAAIAGVFLGEP